MQHVYLGNFYALMAALTWACALVLFKRSTERVPPLALNLFKNTIGLALLSLTLLVQVWLGVLPPRLLWDQHLGDLCLLALSGVIGLALADTLFFHGLRLIGVGLMAVVDCTYTPYAILFSWLLLGEQLDWMSYLGVALIVSGVFVASQHKVPVDRTRMQIALGMALSSLAIGLMAFGIVMAKPVLESPEMSFVAATTLRLLAGTFVLALMGLLGRNWHENWRVFKPCPVWRPAVPASFFGAYLSIMFWVAGFKYTHASVAAVLNQTSVIFAAVLAAVFLKEPFGWQKVVALVLAVVGVLIVTLAGK